MPIQYKRNVAIFEGVCTVEEAEGLLAWLIKHPKGKFNLSACEHLHSAVLQVILAGAPPVSGMPQSAHLAQVLAPLPRAANE